MTQPVQQMEARTLLRVLREAKSHILEQQNIASCPHSDVDRPSRALFVLGGRMWKEFKM